MASTIYATNADLWKTEMDMASQKRKTLPWKDMPVTPITYVQEKDIKARDVQYNPILQTYTNPQVETMRKDNEKDALITTLAKNKDRALRYEQIYDVINFENKLQGLEGHPDYPKEKKGITKKKMADTKVGYNIVSNLPFEQHHFLPPEQRPKFQEEQKKEKKMTTTGLRDYNIITGRYLELNDIKQKTDQAILRKEQIMNYWKTHDYNPILASFYDNTKEKGFVDERDEKSKTHGKDFIKGMPEIVKKEGMLINPVNNAIIDEERLKLKEEVDYNKKKRYETRYEVEQEYLQRNQIEKDMEDDKIMRRINPDKYVDYVPRGIIINMAMI